MKLASDDVAEVIDDLRRLWWACLDCELSLAGLGEIHTLAKDPVHPTSAGILTVAMEVYSRLCDRPLATAQILERAGLLLPVEADGVPWSVEDRFRRGWKGDLRIRWGEFCSFLFIHDVGGYHGSRETKEYWVEGVNLTSLHVERLLVSEMTEVTTLVEKMLEDNDEVSAATPK